MIALALEIGPVTFAASRVTAHSDIVGIRRIPTPTRAVWEGCRELLLDVAGNDEIAAVGIACPGPIRRPAGLVAPAGIFQWRTGFALADAVRRMFPAATVDMATDCHCLGLAGRDATTDLGVDMILAGAAILARTAGRPCVPSSARSGSGLRIDRFRGRRSLWRVSCTERPAR